ncbi:MAG TPA: hypothetical protein VMT69_08675 [Kineosporiaceae bacterium]|nr:hypothetical protein [Kineosporiaceae bacterium]
MSSVEVPLARGLLQRRGKLVIGEESVEIQYPKWREPWRLPIDQVVLADPDVDRDSTEAEARRDGEAVHTENGSPVAGVGLEGGDDSPAVFPRIEVVRIHQERPANLHLVPRHPVQVPRTRRPRWCDVISLAVRAWPTEEQLRGTRLARVPSVEDALIGAYGTVAAPRLPATEMQSGWDVDGVGLTSPGGYSRDPRPVARSASDGAGEGARTSRWTTAAWIASGVVTAAVGAVVCGAIAEGSPDHLGAGMFVLAFAVGFVIRWVRTRSTSRSSRAAGAAAALLTVIALSVGMAGASIADVASEAGVSFGDAAQQFGDLVGWGQLPGLWYASPWDYLIVAGAVWTAYVIGASGSAGLARREGSGWRSASGAGDADDPVA